MNEEVRKAAKPGVRARDLHELAHQVARERGFTEKNMIALTGHGVGLDIAEPPDYGLDETVLQPGMALL